MEYEPQINYFSILHTNYTVSTSVFSYNGTLATQSRVIWHFYTKNLTFLS